MTPVIRFFFLFFTTPETNPTYLRLNLLVSISLLFNLCVYAFKVQENSTQAQRRIAYGKTKFRNCSGHAESLCHSD